MILRPPISTLTDTRFPYTTRFRSPAAARRNPAEETVEFISGVEAPGDDLVAALALVAAQARVVPKEIVIVEVEARVDGDRRDEAARREFVDIGNALVAHFGAIAVDVVPVGAQAEIAFDLLADRARIAAVEGQRQPVDRKSTRLNSSH